MVTAQGPFQPKTASVGGTPTKGVDVPIASIFLVLFIGSAATHMTIFQLNNRRGHKFPMSGAMFGFSMARTVSMIMRIVWACYPHNLHIAIAASVFAAAGVLILYFVNILFVQRILRAVHPRVGWHRGTKAVFTVLYVTVPLILAMIITVVVQSFYTLNPNTHRIDHDVQIAAQAYLIFLSAVPLISIPIIVLIPRSENRPIEPFGTVGAFHSKISILVAGSFLLALGRCFIATSTLAHAPPVSSPAWYDSKAVFWIFYFTVEAIVIYSYALLRVDRRFHVPNGSSGPGHYAAGAAPQGGESKRIEEGKRSQSSGRSDVGVDREADVGTPGKGNEANGTGFESEDDKDEGMQEDNTSPNEKEG